MAITKTSFKKGQTGNPKGRPKKGLSQMDVLNACLKAAGKGKGEDGADITFLQHCCNRAFENDQMAIVLIHKMLPSLRQIDLESNVQVSGQITHKQVSEELLRVIEYDQTG